MHHKSNSFGVLEQYEDFDLMSAEEAVWGTSNFTALQLLIQYVHLNGVYTFSIKLLPSSWHVHYTHTHANAYIVKSEGASAYI
jgi:hypothetical protein